MTDLLDFLAEQVANNEVAWSLGTFGAIAEFTRDADEPVVLDRADGSISAVTARGALRITLHPEFRPIASESITTESWSQRVALCLPETRCAMSERSEFAEIGRDSDALRAEDREGVLFDLGLGTLHAAFQALLERFGNPELVALKRHIVNSVMTQRQPSTVSLTSDRFARATMRVTLRQLQASEEASVALDA